MSRDREEAPRTAKEAAKRIWLESLNLAVEYGTLVLFVSVASGAETFRRVVHPSQPINVALFAGEMVTCVTMVVPKAIRALGEVAQTLAVTAHDVGYAIRYGERRSPPLRPNDPKKLGVTHDG